MDEDRSYPDSRAAFRLSWPGHEGPAAQRHHTAACMGWPVRLSVPSRDEPLPQPRVKLTGQPLD